MTQTEQTYYHQAWRRFLLSHPSPEEFEAFFNIIPENSGFNLSQEEGLKFFISNMSQEHRPAIENKNWIGLWEKACTAFSESWSPSDWATIAKTIASTEKISKVIFEKIQTSLPDEIWGLLSTSEKEELGQCAINSGAHIILEKLLQAGLSPDIETFAQSVENKWGSTKVPLLAAVKNEETAAALIKFGANPNATLTSKTGRSILDFLKLRDKNTFFGEIHRKSIWLKVESAILDSLPEEEKTKAYQKVFLDGIEKAKTSAEVKHAIKSVKHLNPQDWVFENGENLNHKIAFINPWMLEITHKVLKMDEDSMKAKDQSGLSVADYLLAGSGINKKFLKESEYNDSLVNTLNFLKKNQVDFPDLLTEGGLSRWIEQTQEIIKSFKKTSEVETNNYRSSYRPPNEIGYHRSRDYLAIEPLAWMRHAQNYKDVGLILIKATLLEQKEEFKDTQNGVMSKFENDHISHKWQNAMLLYYSQITPEQAAKEQALATQWESPEILIDGLIRPASTKPAGTSINSVPYPWGVRLDNVTLLSTEFAKRVEKEKEVIHKVDLILKIETKYDRHKPESINTYNHQVDALKKDILSAIKKKEIDGKQFIERVELGPEWGLKNLFRLNEKLPNSIISNSNSKEFKVWSEIKQTIEREILTQASRIDGSSTPTTKPRLKTL